MSMPQPMDRLDESATLSRAQRIARMHSMLDSDAGLAKLRSIPAYQQFGEELYETPLSSLSDAAGSIDANGMFMENSYLHSNPD